MELRGTKLLVVSPEARNPAAVQAHINNIENDHRQVFASKLPPTVGEFDPREAGASKGIQVQYGKGNFAITNAFYEAATENSIVVQPKPAVQVKTAAPSASLASGPSTLH